jgi:hypothetical protein
MTYSLETYYVSIIATLSSDVEPSSIPMCKNCQINTYYSQLDSYE